MRRKRASIDAESVVAGRLYGRRREQALLQRCLAEMLAGSGSLVLISGEAGIGKTSLIRQAARQAAGHGCLVLEGCCYDLSITPPYGLWSDIATDEHVFDQSADDLTTLDLLRDDSQTQQLSNPQVLFENVSTALLERSERQPLLLILEDIHWADPASLDLLRYLARRVHRWPMLLVGTYRHDDGDEQGYLKQLLPTLVREGTAEQIHLNRLELGDIHHMVSVHYTLSEKSAGELAEHVLSISGGNPLFVREVLRSLEEERILRDDGSGWRLETYKSLRLPPLVRDVIERRLSRLHPVAQHELAVMAVIGDEASTGLWARMIEAESTQLQETIGAARSAGVLEEDFDRARLRFSHALIREVLYEYLGPDERRELHMKIAEYLAAEDDRRTDPDRIAYHFQRAGDSRSIEWLLRAADRARRTAARITAANRLETALGLMSEFGADPVDEATAHAQLAWMRSYIEPHRSLEHLDSAIQLATEAGADALRATLLGLRGEVQCQIGMWRTGLAEMEQCYQLLSSLEPAQEDRTYPSTIRWNLEDTVSPGPYATGLGFVGRYQEVLDLLGVDPGNPDDMDALAGADLGPLAYGGLGLALAGLGYPEAARLATMRMRQVATGARDWVLTGAGGFWEMCYVTVTYDADRPAELDQIAADSGYAMQRAEGAEGGWPSGLSYLFSYFNGAQWDEIDDLTTVMDRDATLLMIWHTFHWVTAEIARARGDRRTAWERIYEVLPWGSATDPGNSVFLIATRFQRLAVQLALDAGAISKAYEWLSAHDRWLAWNDAVQGRSAGEIVRARYELARGKLDLATEAALCGLDLASRPRQPLSLIRAHRMLADVYLQTRQHGEAEDHINHALELGWLCAAWYEQALNRLVQAELRIETDQTHGLREELLEHHSMLDNLQAKPVLGIVDDLLARLASEFPAGLTAREIDVLRLLTDGLSNAEIALELSISPRTVDHHLRSIYRKIDVPSRAGAIRFAIQHDLA